MLSLGTVLSGVLFAGAVLAQQPPTNLTGTQFISGPNAMDQNTLTQWCTSQITICGTLCNGANDLNLCDAKTLNWTCTCTSNHSTPALQYYPISILGYECNNGLGDCLAQYAGNAAAQANCKTTYQCGNATTQDAANAGKAGGSSGSASGSASSAMATATASGSGSPSASAAATSSAAPTRSAAAAALRVGQEYGTGILALGLMGALGLAF